MSEIVVPIVDQDEFIRLPQKEPDRLFLIMFLLRPGIPDIMGDIEYTLYPPTNEIEAEKLKVWIYKWPEDPEFRLPWAILSMPMSDKAKVEDILRKGRPPFHMSQGTPKMTRGEGGLLSCNREMMNKLCMGPICDCERWYKWPMHGDNVFTIEGGI